MIEFLKIKIFCAWGAGFKSHNVYPEQISRDEIVSDFESEKRRRQTARSNFIQRGEKCRLYGRWKFWNLKKFPGKIEEKNHC